MKKLVCTLLGLALLVACLVCLTACGGGSIGAGFLG